MISKTYTKSLNPYPKFDNERMHTLETSFKINILRHQYPQASDLEFPIGR